jgi:hypothetical protein
MMGVGSPPESDDGAGSPPDSDPPDNNDGSGELSCL